MYCINAKCSRARATLETNLILRSLYYVRNGLCFIYISQFVAFESVQNETPRSRCKSNCSLFVHNRVKDARRKCSGLNFPIHHETTELREERKRKKTPKKNKYKFLRDTKTERRYIIIVESYTECAFVAELKSTFYEAETKYRSENVSFSYRLRVVGGGVCLESKK